jgi:hypothetical protein
MPTQWVDATFGIWIDEAIRWPAIPIFAVTGGNGLRKRIALFHPENVHWVTLRSRSYGSITRLLPHHAPVSLGRRIPMPSHQARQATGAFWHPVLGKP